MAMGKGIGGMPGGTKGARGVRDAVRTRKAASVAAAAGGPKATNPTAGKPSGMGVLGNSKAGISAGGLGAAIGKSVKGRTVGDALTSATGKTSKAGRQPASKKPFGTL
jgi:hypothetical protein